MIVFVYLSLLNLVYSSSLLSISPQYGGVEGGTEVTLLGSGFSSRLATPQVFFGNQKCEVIEYPSTNNKIICLTPPCHDCNVTSWNEWSIQKMVYVTIFVPQPGGIVQKAEGSFPYYYMSVLTPQIYSYHHDISSSNVFQVNGNFGYTDDVIECHVNLLVNDYRMDLKGPSNIIGERTLNVDRRDVLEFTSPTDLPAGFYNYSLNFQVPSDTPYWWWYKNGDAHVEVNPNDFYNDGYRSFFYSDAIKELYNVVVHPSITQVYPASGSLGGGTVVTIQGGGFGRNISNIVVYVGGILCEPISVSHFVLKCLTGSNDRIVTDDFINSVFSSSPTSHPTLSPTFTPTLTPSKSYVIELSVSSNLVIGKQALTVRWSNVQSPQYYDWIGLYCADQYHSYIYTYAESSGEWNVTLNTGIQSGSSCEFRYYYNNGWSLIGKSKSVVFKSSIEDTSVPTIAPSSGPHLTFTSEKSVESSEFDGDGLVHHGDTITVQFDGLTDAYFYDYIYLDCDGVLSQYSYLGYCSPETYAEGYGAWKFVVNIFSDSLATCRFRLYSQSLDYILYSQHFQASNRQRSQVGVVFEMIADTPFVHAGQTISLYWSGVEFPNYYDYIALYCPKNIGDNGNHVDLFYIRDITDYGDISNGDITVKRVFTTSVEVADMLSCEYRMFNYYNGLIVRTQPFGINTQEYAKTTIVSARQYGSPGLWSGILSEVTAQGEIFAMEAPKMQGWVQRVYLDLGIQRWQYWYDTYYARAYFVAPFTGEYNFFIYSNIKAELYLRTSDSSDSVVQIANVTTYNANSIYAGRGNRVYYGDANQRSQTFYLEGGKRYFMQSTSHNNGYNDVTQVGFSVSPDTTVEPYVGSDDFIKHQSLKEIQEISLSIDSAYEQQTISFHNVKAGSFQIILEGRVATSPLYVYWDAYYIEYYLNYAAAFLGSNAECNKFRVYNADAEDCNDCDVGFIVEWLCASSSQFTLLEIITDDLVSADFFYHLSAVKSIDFDSSDVFQNLETIEVSWKDVIGPTYYDWLYLTCDNTAYNQYVYVYQSSPDTYASGYGTWTLRLPQGMSGACRVKMYYYNSWTMIGKSDEMQVRDSWIVDEVSGGISLLSAGVTPRAGAIAVFDNLKSYVQYANSDIRLKVEIYNTMLSTGSPDVPISFTININDADADVQCDILFSEVSTKWYSCSTDYSVLEFVSNGDSSSNQVIAKVSSNNVAHVSSPYGNYQLLARFTLVALSGEEFYEKTIIVAGNSPTAAPTLKTGTLWYDVVRTSAQKYGSFKLGFPIVSTGVASSEDDIEYLWTSDLPFEATAAQVKTALNGIYQGYQFEVLDSIGQESSNTNMFWTVEVQFPIGNIPPIAVDVKNVVGGSISANVKTITDGNSNSFWYQYIPASMLEVPIKYADVLSNVEVFVKQEGVRGEGLKAQCGSAGAVTDFIQRVDSEKTCQFYYSKQSSSVCLSISYEIVDEVTTLTISGRGFLNGDASPVVTLSNMYSCSLTSVSDTSLICTSSYLPAGDHTVQILVPNKGYALMKSDISAIKVPLIIRSIAPLSGSLLGGTVITIEGLGLSADTTVNIGATKCAIISSSIARNSIDCVTDYVGVATEAYFIVNGDSKPYSFQFSTDKTPKIVSFTPSHISAAMSTDVAILGSNLHVEGDINQALSIGGRVCKITSASSTSILCNLPRGGDTAVTSSEVRLMVLGFGYAGKLNALTGKYELPKVNRGFAVSGINSHVGSMLGGNEITISGFGFSSDLSNLYIVTFSVKDTSDDDGMVEYNNVLLALGLTGSTQTLLQCVDVSYISFTKISCRIEANINGSTQIDPLGTSITVASNGVKSACSTTESCDFVFSWDNTPLISSAVELDIQPNGGIKVGLLGYLLNSNAQVFMSGILCETIENDYESGIILDALCPPIKAGYHIVSALVPGYGKAEPAWFEHTLQIVSYDSELSVGSLGGGWQVTLSGVGFSEICDENDVSFQLADGSNVTTPPSQIVECTNTQLILTMPSLVENDLYQYNAKRSIMSYSTPKLELFRVDGGEFVTIADDDFVQNGDLISVQWSDIAEPSDTDWIGFSCQPTGNANGDYVYLSWSYLKDIDHKSSSGKGLWTHIFNHRGIGRYCFFAVYAKDSYSLYASTTVSTDPSEWDLPVGTAQLTAGRWGNHYGTADISVTFTDLFARKDIAASSIMLNLEVPMNVGGGVTSIKVNDEEIATACTAITDGESSGDGFEIWTPCVVNIDVIQYFNVNEVSSLIVTVRSRYAVLDEYNNFIVLSRVSLVANVPVPFGSNSVGETSSTLSKVMKQSRISLPVQKASYRPKRMLQSSEPEQILQDNIKPPLPHVLMNTLMPPKVDLNIKRSSAPVKLAPSFPHEDEANIVRHRSKKIQTSHFDQNVAMSVTFASSALGKSSQVGHRYDIVTVSYSGVTEVSGYDWISYFCLSESSSDYHQYVFAYQLENYETGSASWSFVFDYADDYPSCHFRLYNNNAWDIKAYSRWFEISRAPESEISGVEVLSSANVYPENGVIITFPRLAPKQMLLSDVYLKVEVYGTDFLDSSKFIDSIKVGDHQISTRCAPNIENSNSWFVCENDVLVTHYFPSNSDVALNSLTVSVTGTASIRNFDFAYGSGTVGYQTQSYMLRVRATLYTKTGDTFLYEIAPTASPTVGPRISYFINDNESPLHQDDVITVAWEGIVHPYYDWFGIVCPSKNYYWGFVYSAYCHTSSPATWSEGYGNYTFSFHYSGSLDVNDCQIRLFSAGSWNLLTQTEVFYFEKTQRPQPGAAMSISSPFSVIHDGDNITVKWSGIQNPSLYDFIGLYCPSDSLGYWWSAMTWIYVSQADPVQYARGKGSWNHIFKSDRNINSLSTCEYRMYPNGWNTPLIARTSTFTPNLVSFDISQVIVSLNSGFNDEHITSSIDFEVQYSEELTPQIVTSISEVSSGSTYSFDVLAFEDENWSDISNVYLDNQECGSITTQVSSNGSYASVSCTLPKISKLGLMEINIKHSQYGYGLQKINGVYSKVQQNILYSEVQMVSGFHSGLNGGNVVKLSGVGLADERISVKICDVVCSKKKQLFEEYECITPSLQPIRELQLFPSLQQFKDAIITGLFISSKYDGARFYGDMSHYAPFDGNYETAFSHSRGSSLRCHIGIALLSGKTTLISKIMWYPFHGSASSLVGGYFEGSTDGGESFNVVLAEVSSQHSHEGWNSVLVTSTVWINAVRYHAPHGSSCNIAELQFYGIDAITTSECDVVISMNDTNSINLGTVVYSGSRTPVVSNISPTNGTARGGTTVTITGTGFEGVATVTLSGVICEVQSQSSTKIVCVSRPRDGIQDKSVTVSVATNNGDIYGAIVPKSLEFLYIDRWSDSSSWKNGEKPVEGDIVWVPYGQTLLLDESTPIILFLFIEGDLIFEDSSNRVGALELSSNYIFVHGGSLQIGTESAPFQSSAIVTLYGDRNTQIPIPQIGAKMIAVSNSPMDMFPLKSGEIRRIGVLDIHGRVRTRVWTKVSSTIEMGSTIVKTSEPVDFAAGERIIITSSSDSASALNDYEVEEVIVLKLIDPYTVELVDPLIYTHFSEIVTLENGRKVDMRCEVALISRNVIVRGDDSSVDNLYGVHTMVHGSGVYRVENAEFTRCGQAFVFGRYCLHTHKASNQENSYIKANSIHHSFQRAAVVHGSFYMQVRDNVAYRVMGHTYFVEDGDEMHNVFSGNLAVITLQSAALLLSDLTPASFWTSTPSNIWYDNVAVGSAAFGFWFELASPLPITGSSTVVCPFHGSLGEHSNNTFHNNFNIGLRIYPGYVPYVDSCDSSSGLLTVEIMQVNSFRNGALGMFIRRSGNIRVIDSTFAENPVGIQHVAHEGSFETFSNVENCLFVGSVKFSINDSDSSIRAIWAPQDENWMVSDTVFVNYGVAGVLSGCTDCNGDNHMKQDGFTYRTNALVFENSEVRIKWYDYHRKQIFWDLDGTLTGYTDSMILPYYAFNDWSGECWIPSAAVYGKATLCDSGVKVRRVVISSVAPYTLPWNDLSIVSDAGKGGVYFLPKEVYGWVVPLVEGHKYNLQWESNSDMTSLQVSMSNKAYLTESVADAVVESIVLSYTPPGVYQPRGGYFVTYNGDTFNSEANCTIDQDIDIMGTVCVEGNEMELLLTTVEANMELTDPVSISLSANQCPPTGCPIPDPIEDDVDEPMLWSDINAWGTQGIPTEGENVVIFQDKHIVLDISPPPLANIKIYGRLTFLENSAITLTFQSMEVYGEFLIGSEDAPYAGSAVINITGDFDKPTRNVVVNNVHFLGRKVIAVVGSMQVFGSEISKVWSKLNEEAKRGDKMVIVAGNLGEWQVGSEIVVAATSYFESLGGIPGDRYEYYSEVRLLSGVSYSASDDTTTLRFDTALSYDHTCKSETNNIQLCAAVGLLSRSVVITGSSTPGSPFGFGGSIGVIDLYSSYFKSNVKFSYVEFREMGKYKDQFAALFFNMIYSFYESSTIVGCTFIDGYNIAIESRNTNSLQIVNNIFYKSYGGAVWIHDDSLNGVIDNNLGISSFQQPLTTTYRWSRPMGLFQVYSVVASMKNNIAVGSYDAAFAITTKNMKSSALQFQVSKFPSSPSALNNGDVITLSWNGVKDPKQYDWIAEYCPTYAVAGIYSYTSWRYASSVSNTHVSSGAGSFSFTYNGENDGVLCEYRMYSDNSWTPVTVSQDQCQQHDYTNSIFVGNEAVASRVGVNIISSSDDSSVECVVLNGVKIWKSADFGVLAADMLSPLAITNSVLVENAVGISAALLRFGDFADDVFFGVYNSYISASSADLPVNVHSDSCSLDQDWSQNCQSFTKSDPWGNATSCNSATGNTFRRIGILLPMVQGEGRTCAFGGFQSCTPLNTPQKLCAIPWANRYSIPTIGYAKVEIVGVTFAKYVTPNSKGCKTQTLRDAAIAVNSASIDYTPPVFMSSILWENCDKSSRFGFNSDDSFMSDGQNMIIIHDEDGSVYNGNVGQIVSGPEVLVGPQCDTAYDLHSSASFCSPEYYQYSAVLYNLDSNAGQRRIGPLMVSRVFDNGNEERTYASQGPVEEMCADVMPIGRYPLMFANDTVNFLNMTSGTLPKSFIIRVDGMSVNSSSLLIIHTGDGGMAHNVYVSDDGDFFEQIKTSGANIPTLLSEAGSNAQDPQARSLYITLRGDKKYYKITESPKVQITLKMQMALVDFFENNFIANIVLLLGVPASRVKVVDVRKGSVIVDFNVYGSEAASELEQQTEVESLNTLIRHLYQSGELGVGLQTTVSTLSTIVVSGVNNTANAAPSKSPSNVPTKIPVRQPSVRPTLTVSNPPSKKPTTAPTALPSSIPSFSPSLQPTSTPSILPTTYPTSDPTLSPTAVPSTIPSFVPSRQPSRKPSRAPTVQPSRSPTSAPSRVPSSQPTRKPTTFRPTAVPSYFPTFSPTIIPSTTPSADPSVSPSTSPSVSPTAKPSRAPTFSRSARPSQIPTFIPSKSSSRPSSLPSSPPSVQPSVIPSSVPSNLPSCIPSVAPTIQPSVAPTIQPSVAPTNQPVRSPSFRPSRSPTKLQSSRPSVVATRQPSVAPTIQPSVAPTIQPSVAPTIQPSVAPTIQPSVAPTTQPSVAPTIQPVRSPSSRPSRLPTRIPNSVPSRKPTTVPTKIPTSKPA